LEFCTPYHNTVLIRDGEGNARELFNGQAFDRKTGKGMTTALNPLTNTLRVSIENGAAYMRRSHADRYKPEEAQIFSGSQAEVEARLGKMTQAGHYINDQNLSYVPFGILRHGQNSNSVVRTLVEAAGLSYPQKIRDLFTPGENRTLLPQNWKNAFNALTCSDYMCGLMNGLQLKQLSEQVRLDQKPKRWSLFFNQNAAPNWDFSPPAPAPAPEQLQHAHAYAHHSQTHLLLKL